MRISEKMCVVGYLAEKKAWEKFFFMLRMLGKGEKGQTHEGKKIYLKRETANK
jgi:hypothetical protein